MRNLEILVTFRLKDILLFLTIPNRIFVLTELEKYEEKENSFLGSKFKTIDELKKLKKSQFEKGEFEQVQFFKNLRSRPLSPLKVINRFNADTSIEID